MVIYDLLEAVDLFADGIEEYCHGIVVGDRLLADIFDTVCLFAALYHLGYEGLDFCCAVLDIFNQLSVGCGAHTELMQFPSLIEQYTLIF